MWVCVCVREREREKEREKERDCKKMTALCGVLDE